MNSAREPLSYFLVSLVVCAGAAGMYDDVMVPAGGHAANAAASQTTLASLPKPFAGVDRLRLALIGADERPGDVGRSDTLMIMWVNPERGRAAMLSIPRDLRVAIPGHGTNKVNAAFAYGGAELTTQTVGELLQQPVDGYMKVNFQGFTRAVDTLGGVDLLVEDVEGKNRGMNYDDNWGHLHIHLTPGWHHLDGAQAMGFCRYRKSNIHGLGDGDFKRAERQQEFMRAMVQQKLRVQNLPQLLKAGREIMQCLDTNLSWRQCIDLARLLKEMHSADIKTMTISARDAMLGGVYYCIADENALRSTLATIEQHLDGVTAGAWRVALLDGCGISGVADGAAKTLQTAGFEVVSTGAANSRGYDATRIRYQAADREAALAAATALGAGHLEAEAGGEAPSATSAAPLTIVVGSDLANRRGGSAPAGGQPVEGRNGPGSP